MTENSQHEVENIVEMPPLLVECIKIDVEKKFSSVEQFLSGTPLDNVGALVIRVDKLFIKESRGIYCNVRTRNETLEIIDGKLNSSVLETFSPGVGYPEEFLLEFSNRTDELVIHNWKQRVLPNRNVGQVVVAVDQLVDDGNFGNFRTHILEMKPRGLIHVNVCASFREFHRVGSLVIPWRRMTSPISCLIIANFSLEFENPKCWGSNRRYSEDIGTLCLEELFLRGGAIFSLDSLSQMKGKSKAFPEAVNDRICAHYGVRVNVCQIALVAAGIVREDKMEPLESTIVVGRSHTTHDTIEFYKDACSAYPKMTAHVGKSQYTSREVVLKNLEVLIGKKASLGSVAIPRTLAEVVGIREPRLL